MRGLPALRAADTVAGVDGCRKGWAVACVRLDAARKPKALSFHVVDRFDELRALDVRRLFVDMPMGLSEGKARSVERCARALLPRARKSSIFPVPCRPAVYARTYEECCALNERYAGTRVPKQTYNIAVKIRELDEVLTLAESWRNRIVESHPEICFLRFAGNALPPKRERTGIDRRRAVIAAQVPGAEHALTAALDETLRRDVAVDDLLDAAVLALAAALPECALEQVPARACVDARGIPMRLVFPSRRIRS